MLVDVASLYFTHWVSFGEGEGPTFDSRNVIFKCGEKGWERNLSRVSQCYFVKYFSLRGVPHLISLLTIEKCPFYRNFLRFNPLIASNLQLYNSTYQAFSCNSRDEILHIFECMHRVSHLVQIQNFRFVLKRHLF